MTFYGDMKDTADELIAEFGQLGAIRRPGTTSGPAYDPVIGEPTDEPARIVVTSFANAEIDGTRVLATDLKVLVAPGSLTSAPTVQDGVVLADSSTLSIVNVDTLNPGGTDLLYTLQCRR